MKIPIGTITPGVGPCWLVDICHEDGPVGEAWREAYTSQHRAKRTVREAYPEAPMPGRGFLVLAVVDP